MNGNIPVLMVEGESIAEAWEKSLIKAYDEGCDIQTEYDKSDDPPSKDCSMTILVRNPLAEPMIHKDFPGGLEDLQEYVMEIPSYKIGEIVLEHLLDVDPVAYVRFASVYRRFDSINIFLTELRKLKNNQTKKKYKKLMVGQKG